MGEIGLDKGHGKVRSPRNPEGNGWWPHRTEEGTEAQMAFLTSYPLFFFLNHVE